MDPETQNPETPSSDQPRRRRKRTSRSRFPLGMPAFLKEIGKDVKWYFDVRLYSPLILLLLLLAFLPGKKAAAPEVIAVTEPTILEETQPETQPEPEPIDPEAEALARLADTVGAGRSKNVKTIIMWIAVNRSEDRANGYGLSLIEEINRASQWQGYDENASYSEESYAIAKQVLATIAGGDLRPLDSDMLWLVLNNDGSVTVRNQFADNGTGRWREKTVK